MNGSRLLACARDGLRKSACGVIVLAAIGSSTSLFAQGSSTQDSASGTYGQVQTSYTLPDGCTTVSVGLYFSESGTKSINAPSATPYANASVVYYNYCTSSFVYEFGSTTDGIRFSAQAAGNGSKIPKSITAAGTISMDVYPGGTDTLTFSTTLNSEGRPFETASEAKVTYSLDSGGTSWVQVSTHEDNLGSGSNIASFNVSTSNFGVLFPTTYPADALLGSMGSSKSHQVSVTHSH